MPETLLPIVNLTPVAVPTGTAAVAPLAAGDGAMASPEAFLQALTQSLGGAETGLTADEMAAGFAELVAQVTGELSGDAPPAITPTSDPAGAPLPPGGNPLPDDAALQVLNLLLPPGQPLSTSLSGTDAGEGTEPALSQALGDSLGEAGRRPRAALMAMLHAAANSAVANPAKLPAHDGKPVDPLGVLVAQAVAQVKAGVVAEPGVTTAANAAPTQAAPAVAAASLVPSAPSTTQTALPTQVLEPPVKHEAWGEALGQRVQWLIGQKLQSAQLTLNPPHLGTLEVRINIHQDQAVVQFHTPHAVVREALEAALPRLRDMLGEQGLQLAQANVSQQSFADQQRSAQGRADDAPGQAAGLPGAADGEAVAGPAPTVRIGQGLLDTFA